MSMTKPQDTIHARSFPDFADYSPLRPQKPRAATYSLGKTCPVCGVPIANTAHYGCREHAPIIRRAHDQAARVQRLYQALMAGDLPPDRVDTIIVWERLS